jgi:hypothetical protein
VATFSTSTLPVGIHVISAQYSGDANTKASNSAPITQIIVGPVSFQVTGTSGGSSHATPLAVVVN